MRTPILCILLAMSSCLSEQDEKKLSRCYSKAEAKRVIEARCFSLRDKARTHGLFVMLDSTKEDLVIWDTCSMANNKGRLPCFGGIHIEVLYDLCSVEVRETYYGPHTGFVKNDGYEQDDSEYVMKHFKYRAVREYLEIKRTLNDSLDHTIFDFHPIATEGKLFRIWSPTMSDEWVASAQADSILNKWNITRIDSVQNWKFKIP